MCGVEADVVTGGSVSAELQVTKDQQVAHLGQKLSFLENKVLIN